MHLLSPVKSEELTCSRNYRLPIFAGTRGSPSLREDPGEANSLRSIDAATAVGDADEFLDLPYRSFK